MRNRRSAATIVFSVFFSLLSAASAPAEVQEGSVQYVGIVPFYTPEKIWQLYTPFVDYLNKTTPLTWKLKLYNDHNAIVNGLCSGEITVAYLGPIPFYNAYEKCRAKPLLVSLGKERKPYYRSVVITTDPAVTSMKDLKGKRITFYKNSTASYFALRKMLEDEGIALESIQPVYVRSQDRIIDALLRNEAAAGAVKDSLYEEFKNLNIRRVKHSHPLPPFTFCASPSVSPETEKAFKGALLRLKPLSKPSDKQLMEGWDPELEYGFAPTPKKYRHNVLKLKAAIEKYRDKD